jgi:DNA-directed RNA polymerase subunit RPC12/RpoP
MSKVCIDCGKDKDKFSREWDYAQCQACSMQGGE